LTELVLVPGIFFEPVSAANSKFFAYAFVRVRLGKELADAKEASMGR